MIRSFEGYFDISLHVFGLFFYFSGVFVLSKCRSVCDCFRLGTVQYIQVAFLKHLVEPVGSSNQQNSDRFDPFDPFPSKD